MKKQLALCGLFCILSNILFAQTDTLSGLTKSAVIARSRALKDRILLRWVVNDINAWAAGNKYGFNVERWTVEELNKKITYSKKKKVNASPLKPPPLQEWKPIAEKDEKALVIAAALYEKSFNLSDKATNIGETLDKADEANMRFIFSLLAADQSFQAAKFAGWGLEDTTVESGKKYVYNITLATPRNVPAIDSARVFTSLSDYYDLPKPLDLAATFGNKTVNLSWNKRALGDIYSMYFIEKSEDGTHFKRVSDVPFTNLSKTEEENTDIVFYTDSLAQNDKAYFYRVRGISCFGEVGAPSEVVYGKGLLTLSFAPNILQAEILNDSTANLTWDIMKDSTISLLSYFELSQSDNADGGFKVVKSKINKNDRKLTFQGLLPTNYFMISAIDKNGNKMESFPYLVQTIDATPPVMPIGLKGEINDKGVVALQWTPNPDKDIYGYYVYRSNIQGEEMSLLSDEPYLKTAFSDTVSLEMMTKKVYYAIAAVDQRYNRSKISEIIEIKKPDKIPPTAPTFNNFKLTETNVQLSWESSSSDDVAFQRLYRKDTKNKTSDAKWDLIKEYTSRDSVAYVDTLVNSGKTYSYTLVAIDDSDNESDPSSPLTVEVPIDKRNKEAVKDLKAIADKNAKKILVEWTYAEKGVLKYQIYRKKGKEPISLWKIAEQDTTGIIDEELSPGNEYKYAVRAVFGDGRTSAWNEVKVSY
jgi:uncharacterized protein